MPSRQAAANAGWHGDPDRRIKETVKRDDFEAESKTAAGETCGIIRQAAYLKSGGEAKCGVKRRDDGVSPGAPVGFLCIAEFRNEPLRVRGSPSGNAPNDRDKFRVGETVEEKMSGDQVVALVTRLETAYVCDEESNALASLAVGGRKANFREFDHLGAEVDEIHFDGRIDGKQLGEKTAVASPTDNGALRSFGVIKKCAAASFERPAEGDAFEELVERREPVAIHGSAGMMFHVASRREQ